jgi:serine/threonine-protein kinase
MSGTKYRIIGFIGRGGMGEVYRAMTLDGRALVAIKTLPLALAADPKVVLRTQFESAALRELRHRNVVEVLASGVRNDGVIFMVMEHLRGVTLLELMRDKGRIPIPWSLVIARDVSRGLVGIHEVAVHRDIKPANVHLGVDGVVRILDLGAAKWKRSGLRLTTLGTQVGTLTHMAPELLDESGPADGRADVWSVGVLLYELVSGRHPFALDGRPPDNPYVLGGRILDDPHVPLRAVAPLCPPSLARLVDKTLAKDPRDRHGSAEELLAAISAEIRAFERVHGVSPPIEELAAQLFPASAGSKQGGGAGGTAELRLLASTAPLDPNAPRAQPSALPYARTVDPAQETAEVVRRVLAAGAPVAPQPEPPRRPSEPEPPRVSDVYVKRAPLQETAPDVPVHVPGTVRETLLPRTPPGARSMAGAQRRGLARIVGLVAGGAGLVATGALGMYLGIRWFHPDMAPPDGTVAAPPAASSAPAAPLAPPASPPALPSSSSSARPAAPAASAAAPRRSPAAGPPPGRSGR